MAFVAIDIGASSGRHIVGNIKNGIITMKEVYRFQNGMRRIGDTDTWDVEYLLNEVIHGLSLCKNENIQSIAIDTWGVDYVLLDKDGDVISPVTAYRDAGRATAKVKADAEFPPEDLYRRSGIYPQSINTVYGLYRDAALGRLQKAERFLMIPEYLCYKLTGAHANEITNASTTGLLNADTRTWDKELLQKLGIPLRLFTAPVEPGYRLGRLLPEIERKVGFNCDVLLCATHDTASAVIATPLQKNDVFLSSGTWSLLGVENERPVTSKAAFSVCLSNEFGIGGSYRFLKNIMGLWMIQTIRKELSEAYSFAELSKLAATSKFTALVDVNDPHFLNPDNMTQAVYAALGVNELPTADLLACVYRSLAVSYRNTVRDIETISGHPLGALHIVGGGCQNTLLNRLTAAACGRPVFAGPVEATALGNLGVQMMAANKSLSLSRLREIITNSFSVTEVRIHV